MRDYILHFLIGLGAAGIGYYFRAWCIHTWHRVTLTVLFVAIETVIAVNTVG